MKFRKLAIAATAAMMATSVGATAGAQSIVKATTLEDDIRLNAAHYRAENAQASVDRFIFGTKLALGIAGLAIAGGAASKRADEMNTYAQNHSQFHLKKNKVYLILHNGKRAGKKYFMKKGGYNYTQSWVIPKKTYKIHGMKCYFVGKTKSGKRMYLPVKYTAYTHTRDSQWK